MDTKKIRETKPFMHSWELSETLDQALDFIDRLNRNLLAKTVDVPPKGYRNLGAILHQQIKEGDTVAEAACREILRARELLRAWARIENELPTGSLLSQTREFLYPLGKPE